MMFDDSWPDVVAVTGERFGIHWDSKATATRCLMRSMLEARRRALVLDACLDEQ